VFDEDEMNKISEDEGGGTRAHDDSPLGSYKHESPLGDLKSNISSQKKYGTRSPSNFSDDMGGLSLRDRKPKIDTDFVNPATTDRYKQRLQGSKMSLNKTDFKRDKSNGKKDLDSKSHLFAPKQKGWENMSPYNNKELGKTTFTSNTIRKEAQRLPMPRVNNFDPMQSS